ncbi:biotin-dependent carboxyltransferase family protein [Brevibacillus marinus]|uniref:5-oxoprolinase subunit C family protein n=1 Tax=Brevibacillus marinus TaxID=2496837 RepID=UPI000F849DB5|nr:biotin-dependent carboxyltransferase family protein [Brevibacillus marinus]
MAQRNPVFEVIKPGLFTTVQDLGRFGYQQYGMAVSGAMDPYALRIGNLLVGNEEGAAGLEMTLVGPVLKACRDCLIAITGGDLNPHLDGVPLPMWKSVVMPQGSVLAFQGVKRGCRAYLAVRGGIDVPLVMGSRSTYVKAKLGGYQGRPLQSGDVLPVGLAGASHHPQNLLMYANRSLHPEAVPQYASPVQARVILGPDYEMFRAESVRLFLSQPYTISPQADRMGYRLTGARLEHKGQAEIISDAIPFGAIQVPASGEPILLLADRQPTGGYPKIATVISSDLPLVAQAKPGEQIRFTAVTLEESQQLLYEQESVLQTLRLANRLLRHA